VWPVLFVGERRGILSGEARTRAARFGQIGRRIGESRGPATRSRP
jgi:hypothetical protein